MSSGYAGQVVMDGKLRVVPCMARRRMIRARESLELSPHLGVGGPCSAIDIDSNGILHCGNF